MRVLVIVLLLMMSSSQVKATDDFYYDGLGLSTTDAYQQMLDHTCLAMMIFLEARGDGELSQLYHGMATINRVRTPNKWDDNVCAVILQPSQYESIGPIERKVLESVLQGDIYAVDNYIYTKYDKPVYSHIWRRVMRIAYGLIRTTATDATWIEANHFYSLKSLQMRGLSTPDWIAKKTVVGIAGDTYFLK